MSRPYSSPEQRKVAMCDHKFIDSNKCAKCGREPPRRTEPDGAAVVTRGHREAALRAHYPEGTLWSRELAWVESGELPIYPLLARVAQAIASAEARARTESQTELARLRAELTRANEYADNLVKSSNYGLSNAQRDRARLIEENSTLRAEVLRLEGELAEANRRAVLWERNFEGRTEQLNRLTTVTDEQLTADLETIRSHIEEHPDPHGIPGTHAQHLAALARITAALAMGHR